MQEALEQPGSDLLRTPAFRSGSEACSLTLFINRDAASYKVLGVRVDALQIPDVVSRMEEWIVRRDACRYIAVMDMHSLMQAQRAASFKTILQEANLVVPDGFPIVWLGRR